MSPFLLVSCFCFIFILKFFFLPETLVGEIWFFIAMIPCYKTVLDTWEGEPRGREFGKLFFVANILSIKLFWVMYFSVYKRILVFLFVFLFILYFPFFLIFKSHSDVSFHYCVCCLLAGWFGYFEQMSCHHIQMVDFVINVC